MRLTIQNAQNDQIFVIEIDDDGTVFDIKTIAEVESGIPTQNQALLHNGRLLMQDEAKVQAVGIKNDDLIVLTPGGLGNMFGMPG